MKIIAYLTQRVPLIVLTAAMMALSLGGQFYEQALHFLTTSSQTLLISLGIITELKAAASSLGSSHIPLLGGAATSVSADLDKAFDYVSFAGILMLLQTLVLKLFSASFWLKILPLVFLAGTFINPVRSFCQKMVLMLLLINPGLGLFVYATSYVSGKMQLDLGTGLQQHLQQTQAAFNQKEQARKQAEDDRNQQQLQKAEEKGKDHISLLNRVEDAVADDASNVALEVEKAASLSFDVLKSAGEKLTGLLLNLIASVILIFLLLPLAYVYLLSIAVKKIFDKTPADPMVAKPSTLVQSTESKI